MAVFNILHKKHAANKANVETFEPKRCSIDNILNDEISKLVSNVIRRQGEASIILGTIN